MEGKFHIFRLSGKHTWFLTKDGTWDNKKGSYILYEGMLWPGFTPPSGVNTWKGFSIVQLDMKVDKDQFFISGGEQNSAGSKKAYLFNTEVSQ